jgi:predicted nucleic acid-binding protein
MAPSVYIETSVISYLTAFPSRDVVLLAHQQITQSWWSQRGHYDLYVSQAVLDEAAAGSPDAAARRLDTIRGIPIPEVTTSALEFATELINTGVLPAKALVDSIHVAAAAVNGIDYLLTWNCKHIANVAIRARIERSCRVLGLQPPLICTPEELSE